VNPMTNHPNATVSLIAGLGIGSAVVQIGAHFGLHLSAQQGAYFAAGLGAIALFIGRNGAVGTWAFVKNLVLHGTSGNAKKRRPKP